jgi:ComF family protein
VRLGEYGGLLRELVHELKFDRCRSVGVELGHRLGRAVREAMIAAGLDPAGAVVVPVPMSFRRRWSRGVDHARMLSRLVAKELGCPMLGVLSRRHRPAQWTVPESRRRANVRGVFRVNRGVVRRLKGRTMVVVDDVRTTGATLTECCSTILRAMGEDSPVGVWVAVVGVASGPDWRGRA